MENYTNPNDAWMRRRDIEDYDTETATAGCCQMLLTLLIIFLTLIVCALLGSCRSVELVPVVHEHTEHHWHTDSIHTRDTIMTEKTTTVMQLDSAQMSAYGIHLQQAERAWLVRTSELERFIRELQQKTEQRDTIRDSIPVPFVVEKKVEVPKPLTWWQSTRQKAGGLLFLLLFLWLAWKIFTLLRTRQ